LNDQASCAALCSEDRDGLCARALGGFGRMGDDSSKAPLTRRVPGATRAGPASSSRPELPEELLQRMQAVVNAAHAQARQEEEAGAKPTASGAEAASRRGFETGNGPKPANGARAKLTVSLRGRLSDADAESDTDELPRLTASGAIANPELAGPTTARPSHSASADQLVKPGRRDHAAKRDRRAERRERAAQAERERTARAEQAAQAERERIREAELAARAVEVLRERERAAREQAEREAAARTERDRAEREQAQREAAARAERERTERERAARAERERAEREAAARAEREKAAQAERERAEREERDRAAREREREAHERAAQAARERAAREQAERERAVQMEREQAEREQVQREQAERERERAAQAERELAEREGDRQAASARTAEAEPDEATDGAASPNGVAAPDGILGLDRTFRPETAVRPDTDKGPAGQRAPATARADVLEHPRRAARQTQARRRRGRTVALIAAAAVVVVAGPVAILMSRHSPAPPDGSGSGVRNEAAAWISQQVDPNDVVSCDLAMCQTLEANGVPTGDLLVMNAGQRNLLGSSVVVSTSAIRQLFGRRLDSDAPVILAGFGSGRARIDIRVVVQHGTAQAYLSQLSTQVQERKNVGRALVNNPKVALSATARNQLLSGEVDPRLLILLPSFQTSRTLDILAFGDVGPGASAGVPLRCVYLAETGAIANVRSAFAILRSQRSTLFSPAHAESTRFDGKPALYIEFAAPSPLGVFTNPGP
jgi:hypothetical protein